VASPIGTQQLPQEKYAEELTELDEAIVNLQVLYEKYFLGIDRRPPEQERKRISQKTREMRTTNIRNTALKFKINTLFAKLLSFERMWDRTLREIEDGTYKRDVFKAKLRDKDRDERHLGVQPAAGNAEAQPQPRSEHDGQDGARSHDAEVELALHQLEALDADGVGGQAMVDEEARQVEESREPRNHEYDVQRLDDEHCRLPHLSRRRRVRTSAT